MKKRILSMLLAILMVVTLLPTVAFAEGTSNQAQWGVAQGTSAPATWEGSGTLAEALTYAERLTDGTAYIQLLNSVKTESYVDIKFGMSAVLDLNGHDIDRGLTGMQIDGFVIYTKGNLTLCDTSAEGQGKITGGYANASTFGSGVYVYNGGSFTMLGGNITGNTAYQNGGSGVRVNKGATFTMYGGNIYGNTCTYTGGTVNVCGTMYLYGGNIYGNSAYYAAGIYVMEGGSLEMSGGTVGSSDPAKGNVATSEGGTCGVSTNGVFTMTGGSIINNTGVGVYVGSKGTFNVSGTVNISGNKMDAAECNIQLAKDKTITVAGPLNCTTPIGVVGKKDQVITSGWRTYMGAADLDAYFESDTSNLYLDVNTNGEVFFTATQPPVKYTVTAAEAVADKITLSHTKAAKDTTVTISSALTDPNIVLTSVICTADDGTEVATTANNGGFEFSMPECAVTVTATFETLYPVWVGGVQIASTNLVIDGEDMTGITGSATFNPETSTLTLNNFSHTSEGDTFNSASIYATLEHLTVNFVGSNTVACSAENGYALHNYGALTITTDDTNGSLSLTGDYYGIQSSGDIIISDCRVTAQGNNGMGIAGNGTIAITNSFVTASGARHGIAVVHAKDDDDAIAMKSDDLTITNSTVVATGGEYALFYDGGEYEDDEGSIRGGLIPKLVFDNKFAAVAGSDAESAVMAAADAAATYENKHVRIVSVHDVTYKVDGEEVKTLTVEHGKDASAPEIPAKTGYIAAWSADGKNITADTEINAVYTVKKYTVTYKADGKVVKTVEVEHGKDATAPEIPAKEGYNETAPKWDKDGKNITADTVINAVYTKNESGEYSDVTPDTNVGGGKLTENVDTLKDKIPFGPGDKALIEQGADVEIRLEIKDISKSVPADDKAKVEAKLGDGNVAMYLDISMFMDVGGIQECKLTELTEKTKISFKLPDSFINTDKDVTRTYSIIHVHDGKAEIITPVFDAVAKTLTFETDQFSTYAVVYTDVVTTPPTEETVPPTEKPAPPAETPATGDSFQPAFWIACMTLSIFGIAVLLLDAKRRHAR